MTVFFNKSRDRWQYEFQLGGARHSKYCLGPDGQPVTSRRAALIAEAEAKRQAMIGPKLPRAGDLAVAQVADQLGDIWIGGAQWPARQRHLREMVAFFGAATPMRDISGAMIQDYIACALRQPLMVWKGGNAKKLGHKYADRLWVHHPGGKLRSASTVNRYLPALRAMFQRAYDTRDGFGQRCIEEIPKIEDLKEPKRKARPVPDDILIELLAMLPPHSVDALKATLFFGFRKLEVFSLTITQVDFGARGIRLDANDVKDREDAFIPGSAAAMEFMRGLVDQAKARRVRHLITWPGNAKLDGKKPVTWRPMKGTRTAWRNAMAKIEKPMAGNGAGMTCAPPSSLR